jgi:hypothetical protein
MTTDDQEEPGEKREGTEGPEEETNESGEWVTIRGVVVEGYGVASGESEESPYPEGSITTQLPFFRELGLDFSTFYPATLNISIHPLSFALKYPEHTFRQVKWSGQAPAEDFSFAPCRVTLEEKTYRGYVYYPHPETKPDHHHDPSTVEIITGFIPNVAYGTPVELQVRRDQITVLAGADE